MASLQQRSGSYRVIFRHRGKQHFVTTGQVSAQQAKVLLDLAPAHLDCKPFLNHA
jgi:hypothetical protein